jgi:ABC-2 type transport system ATP-binding protein
MISLQGLTKSFGGTLAVDALTLEVPAGQILGLLGPNGAGKTTTLKMVTGMLAPTIGTARICGVDIVKEPLEAKRLLGFVPDSGAVYEALTGLEYLLLVAALYGIAEDDARPRIRQFLDFFELDERTLKGKLLGAYSKGMRRKIVITAALLHNPKVVLLDEPLDGLDANSARVVKELLRSLAGQGKAILFCSHILEVVERVCTRIVVLNRGEQIAVGTPGEIAASVNARSLDDAFAVLTGVRDANQVSGDILRALERS